MVEQDRQSGTGRTGQEKREDRTRQAVLNRKQTDRQNETSEWDKQKTTVRTGLAEQVCRDKNAEDCEGSTASTYCTSQDMPAKTAMTGEKGSGG